MAASSVTSEAILFFDHRGISKSMLYADFEAILDGMVGVPEFADKEVRGAYCLVNGQLRVRHLECAVASSGGTRRPGAGHGRGPDSSCLP